MSSLKSYLSLKLNQKLKKNTEKRKTDKKIYLISKDELQYKK